MKKINVRKVSDILSDSKLKHVLGGYTTGTCYIDGECVCRALCSSDSQCVNWYGSGAKCSCARC